MVKQIKKMLLLTLLCVITINTVGCKKQPEKFDANGYSEATEFKVYSRYGDNEFSAYIEDHETPWRKENIKTEKTLKIGDKKIKLLYEFSEMPYASDLYDKYLWEENPAVKVYYYGDTDAIAKIVTEEEIMNAPITFLPDFGNMLDKESFTSYAILAFEMFSCDISNKELSYKTSYINVKGPERTLENIDEFYIPDEDDELNYISVSFCENTEFFDRYTYYSLKVSYDKERKVKSVELNFSPIPPSKVFSLTEEEAMNMIFENEKQKNDNIILECTDNKYTIRYEDGSELIYKGMTYTLFGKRTCVMVHVMDVLPGGASCGLAYYIFPSEVTFP